MAVMSEAEFERRFLELAREFRADTIVLLLRIDNEQRVALAGDLVDACDLMARMLDIIDANRKPPVDRPEALH